MVICVYGASSDRIDDKYKIMAEELGRELAERGHSLVFGGGAAGLMGATARGVCEKGGKIIGVTPNFLNVDGALFDKCDEEIRTDTMRQRKQIMEDRSDAFIVTPGGIGTYEEFFEMLTTKQLAVHNKPIVVFNMYGFYEPLLEMIKYAVKNKFISERTINLFGFCDNVKDVLDYVENYKDGFSDVEETRFVK